MSSLQSILADHEKTYLSGPDAESRKQKLRQELKSVRSTNERYFIAAVLLLATFFVASWVLVFLTRYEPGFLTIIFGALGGSVFGSIWAMLRLWQTKVATDLVIVMLEDMPPSEFKLAIRAILKRL
jgi:hypothetical protein